MLKRKNKSTRSRFLSLFPLPKSLETPLVGVSVTDQNITFVEFEKDGDKTTLKNAATHNLAPDIFGENDVIDRPKLVAELKEFKKKYNLGMVNVALPEGSSYLFETEIPRVSRKDTLDFLSLKIEGSVPISLSDSVFDYDVVLYEENKTKENQDAIVSVYPKKIAEEYVSMFKEAGMVPMALETEAQSVARAIIQKGNTGTSMIVDFGYSRSIIAIVSGGVVNFSTSIPIGGNVFDEAIKKIHPDIAGAELRDMKTKKGCLNTGEDKGICDAMRETAAVLKEEIDKHYVYWHTYNFKQEHRKKIEKVYLSGNNSDVAGLVDYLSLHMKTDVQLSNVWINAINFEEDIPNISFNKSLKYASAVGLALVSEESVE